jgi:hypothetical protein
MAKKKSFWTTVPGILTGIASVIAALTALYLALNPLHKDTIPSGAQPAATPLAATKAPSPSGWPLIAEETFTKEGWGWTIGSFPEEGRSSRFDLRVVDGKYRWDIEYKYIGSQHRTLISPYGSAVNFKVAVDVQFTDFTHPMTANLVFGSTGNEQYEFMVSLNRYFALFIYDVKNKQYTTLIDATPITVKFEPDAWNRMSVVVDEQLIRCYLNSEVLGEYRHVGFTGGKVGLGVGTDQGGSVVIDFDNFEFRRKP